MEGVGVPLARMNETCSLEMKKIVYVEIGVVHFYAENHLSASSQIRHQARPVCLDIIDSVQHHFSLSVCSKLYNSHPLE